MRETERGGGRGGRGKGEGGGRRGGGRGGGVWVQRRLVFLKELCRFIKPGLTPEELGKLNAKS